MVAWTVLVVHQYLHYFLLNGCLFGFITLLVILVLFVSKIVSCNIWKVEAGNTYLYKAFLFINRSVALPDHKKSKWWIL